MLNQIFQSSTIPVLQEVIGFAQARHGVLAGNVANWDTPGYRVRDLSVEDFQKRLKEAIEARSTSREAHSPGLVRQDPDEAMRQVRESFKHILYHDGSNVSMEHQVTEIAKNQQLHNVAIALLSSQFRVLQAAISERI